MRAAVAEAGLGAVRLGERAGAGRRNDVWLVTTSRGDEAVVRLLVDEQRRAMEVALLERAAVAGVPVAEVLWSTSEPVPVMVQRRLPGRRLAEVPSPRPGVVRSVALVLRRIHAIPVDGGFGNLRSALRGEDDVLSHWFTQRVAAEAAGVEEPLLQAGLAELASARSLLDRQRTGLAHGDLQPHNLLVVGDEVSGVLDWEAAKAGPPSLDLGWWDWFSGAWSTPWAGDDLVDAYDPEGSLDREELATMRRLVVLRVWLRELVAALRTVDATRAAAARRGILASLHRPPR